MKLNPSDYSKKYYISELNGNDSVGNGSKESPYKTIGGAISSIGKIDEDSLFYLDEGIYTTVSNMFNIQPLNNLKVSFVGKNMKTTLIQNQRLGEQNGSGNFGNSRYTLSLYNLIYTSANIDRINTLDFRFKWQFYNVVFDKLYDATYGYFLSRTYLGIFDCTKTNNSLNFIRCSTGEVEVKYSYGGFTSGHNTQQSQWDTEGNKITANPALNDKFFIIDDESKNKEVGVYSGDNTWIVLPKFFLVKQEANYILINNNYYNLGRPRNDDQLIEWYKKYGYDKPDIISDKLNIKDFPLITPESSTSNRTMFELDANEIINSIEFIEDEDKGDFIRHGSKEYRIYDKLADRFDKFEITMIE
ncbi:MAG: hypothetical protein AB2417_15725 [Clostridiaceae bacterium]